MTARNQRLHSSASYRDAADRTTTFINDPVPVSYTHLTLPTIYSV